MWKAKLGDSIKQEREVAQAVQDGITKQLAGERKKNAEQESISPRLQIEDELKAVALQTNELRI